MKAIKLILIAVLVIGGIYALLHFLGNSGTADDENSPEREKVFDRLQTRIDSEWEDRTTWDASLFETSYDLLQQNKRKLKTSSYNTLLDQLAAYGATLLHQDMMAEFAKADCDTAVIEAYYRDLQTFLGKTTGYAHDNNVTEMQETYNLFSDILRAAAKGYNVEPNFNAETGVWTDFSGYSSRILADRDGFARNRYYSNISNATVITEAIASIAGKVEQAKTQFKNKLAHQIIDAYTNIARTEENKSTLASIHSQFMRQFGRQDDLNNFVLYY